MISRRDVVTTTLAAGAGLAMAQPSQPAKAQPAGRIIVDSQVHLWLANTPERPWPVDGIGQAHIPRPFSYYELSARMEEAGVDRVVIVPPSWEGYHNEYAMEAAKKWPHRFAVMGRLRLDDPKSKDLLATWKDQPGMLGVRHTFLADRRHRRLVLAGRRQGRHPGDDADRRTGARLPAHRRAQSGPRLHHRPHEPVR